MSAPRDDRRYVLDLLADSGGATAALVMAVVCFGGSDGVWRWVLGPLFSAAALRLMLRSNRP